MAQSPRNLAFVLAASDQGTLIVNRFDYNAISANAVIGVGHQILSHASYEANECQTVRMLLGLRRQYFGDGVIAVDCGANIGVFTVDWAKWMTGWGAVLGIEAQERIFYALAGNVAINNCNNAQVILGAIGAQIGVMQIAVPDYTRPGTFGSLELIQNEGSEFIGQEIDQSPERLRDVRCLTLDSLNLGRLDFLKVDVEGMELDVLAGGRETIARHLPIMLVERIKADTLALQTVLASYGYQLFPTGINILAVHPSDQTINHLSLKTAATPQDEPPKHSA